MRTTREGAIVSGFKAIPTTYNGRVYRSRLESNVAQMLDQLEIEFEFEPSSFLLDDGTHYMPDFWCPRIRLWIEVRGYSTPKADRQIKLFGEAIMSGRLTANKMLLAPSTPTPLCEHASDDQCSDTCEPRWRSKSDVDYMVLSPGGHTQFFEVPSWHTCRGIDNAAKVCLCRCGAVCFCSESNDWRCRVCGESDKHYQFSAYEDILLDGAGRPVVQEAVLDIERRRWEHLHWRPDHWLTNARKRAESEQRLGVRG